MGRQQDQVKKSAMLATTGLGMLIFVDDYFNCLTVGSVMRPVTDRYKVSRAKLAYIIDATVKRPVCISREFQLSSNFIVWLYPRRVPDNGI